MARAPSIPFVALVLCVLFLRASCVTDTAIIFWHGFHMSYNDQKFVRPRSFVQIMRDVANQFYGEERNPPVFSMAINSAFEVPVSLATIEDPAQNHQELAKKESQSSATLDLEKQVEMGKEQLKNLFKKHHNLKHFIIIGTSLGGVLSRVVVQSDDELSARCFAIISVGSPQEGIKELPQVFTPSDEFLQKNKITLDQYVSNVSPHKHLVRARGHVNGMLAHYNKPQNAKRLEGKHFIMYKFTKDSIVTPASQCMQIDGSFKSLDINQRCVEIDGGHLNWGKEINNYGSWLEHLMGMLKYVQNPAKL